MEKKIYWGVALFSLVVMVASVLYPGKPTEKDDLPWHIEHPTPDAVRIFGLTLGKSNTDEAEQRFREAAKPSLFKSKDGRLVAEVFFEQVDLAGLRSKIVLNIGVPEPEIQGMYERGLRLSSTGSGKKITLAPEDEQRLRQLPIVGLTYMPSVRLEEAILLKRFGAPSQRIKEKESGVIHWLYPQNGLDISLSEKEKPLMQYVQPVEFEKLSTPLLASGEVVTQ